MSFSGMSFAEWLGLFIGLVSALFGYLAWRTSRRSVRVSEEQLRLAQEQAEMRPELEVSEAELLDFLDAVKDPQGRQVYYYYDDPLPDKVLRISIVNRGRTPAHKISGWIYFDPDYLKPDDRHGDGVTADDLTSEGLFRVEGSGSVGVVRLS